MFNMDRLGRIFCLATLLMALCCSMPTELSDAPNPRKEQRPLASQTRLKRQAVETEIENEKEYFRRVGGENITGVSYMLQLYRELSNSNEQATKSNIIKSLNYEPLSEDQPCNEFKFTLVDLKSHEVFHQAKLRLFLKKPVLQAANYATATIQVRNSSTGYADLVVFQDISTKKNGYIEFNVTGILKPLIGKGRTIILVLSVFRNDSSILNCKHDDEVIFENSLLDEEKIPILTVHSYLKIDMQINESMEFIQQQVEIQHSGHRRRKRSAIARRVCGVLEFVIPTADIPQAAFSDYVNFRPIVPASYNSGICGGQCLLSVPHANSSPYAIFLHLLIRRGVFADHDYSFAQSCVPVEFDPVHILGVSEGTVVMVSIDDMIVRSCGCADFAI